METFRYIFPYFSVVMSNISGEHRFVPWEMVDYWHLVYTDSSTCDNSVTLFDDISYTIQLMNKNKQGNSVDHFSYDQAGKCEVMSMIISIVEIIISLRQELPNLIHTEV